MECLLWRPRTLLWGQQRATVEKKRRESKASRVETEFEIWTPPPWKRLVLFWCWLIHASRSVRLPTEGCDVRTGLLFCILGLPPVWRDTCLLIGDRRRTLSGNVFNDEEGMGVGWGFLEFFKGQGVTGNCFGSHEAPPYCCERRVLGEVLWSTVYVFH